MKLRNWYRWTPEVMKRKTIQVPRPIVRSRPILIVGFFVKKPSKKVNKCKHRILHVNFLVNYLAIWVKIDAI